MLHQEFRDVVIVQGMPVMLVSPSLFNPHLLSMLVLVLLLLFAVAGSSPH
jgi:hypothetical protein